MNYERIKKYKDLILLIIGVLLISYLFCKHLLVYLLPFFIGWFLAFAMRPPASFIARKLKIKPKIVRLFLTLLVFFAFFTLCSVAIWLLSREVWELVTRLGRGDSSLDEFISDFASPDGFIGKLFGNFGDYVADALYSLLTSVLTRLASSLSTVVSLVPKSLLFILVTVIASAYFAVSLEEVNRAVKSILPESLSSLLIKLKDGFLGAFLKYMRSYLLLLVITFFEMLVGLFILKAPYPLLMAIVIAVLDLLPIIGVGFVLIPWGVWSIVIGNVPFGIGLLVLFVFQTIIREIIEPKIVGKNLGTHPILTLIFIYVGYSLFGVIGLILVPVLTVLVNIAFGKKDSSEVTEHTLGEGHDA